MEPVLRGMFKEFANGKKVTPSFPRIPYAEAMLKYGSDKPDLRNPLEIVDVTEDFAREDVTFKAFKNVIRAGDVVRAIPAPGAASQPRSFFDKLNEWARGGGRGGPGLRRVRGGGRRAGRQGPDRQVHPGRRPGRRSPKAGAEGRRRACSSPPARRRRPPRSPARRASASATSSELVRQGPVRVLLDHGLPACTSGTRTTRRSTSRTTRSRCRRSSRRNSSPSTPDDRETILGLKAYQYDIVCNGYEMSSGAIRNHRPDIMLKAFAHRRLRRERDRGKVRRHDPRLPLRRAAAWRHRAGHRPHRDAALRRAEPARGHACSR